MTASCWGGLSFWTLSKVGSPSCRSGWLVLDGPRFGQRDRAECLKCGYVSERLPPGTYVLGVGVVGEDSYLSRSSLQGKVSQGR